MCGTLYRRISMLVMLACWLGSASAASANVNLEWRLESPGLILVGDTVRIGLFAVSDDATNQVMSSMQVVVTWDPTSLQLLGLDNNGFPWPNSAFLTDPLNESNPPADGDGLYFALGPIPPSPLPEATPAGLLVTTFQFTALNSTCSTVLDIPASLGSPPTSTRVFSGIVGGLSITGTLDQISLDIGDANSQDCDTNGQPDECQADGDGDGVIDPCDNCPRRPNPGQADSNNDGFGDACLPRLVSPGTFYEGGSVITPLDGQPAQSSTGEGAPAPLVGMLTGNCAPMEAASMSMCLVGILLMQWTHRRRRSR